MNTPGQDCWLMRKFFDARSWLPLSTTLHTMTDQGGFSIEKEYTSMLPQYQKADWSKLALVKGLIPRHHFIKWVALHRKLSTVHRLKGMGFQKSIGDWNEELSITSGLNAMVEDSQFRLLAMHKC
ncbi:hypothetical protein HAX54_023457 [Datura stramonium]|uniref:Reverse transcriptase zinc-binding domain-containing protein n=1 Tax=Datura stramonium TaxID=4076 RepID=A0ABS8S4Q6_DATST|nr:hypothetical protein [Datura stramonium]